MRKQGHAEQAESCLRVVIASGNPEHTATAWIELGNLVREAGRFAEAQDAFQQAVELGQALLRERWLFSAAHAVSSGGTFRPLFSPWRVPVVVRGAAEGRVRGASGSWRG